MSGYRPDDDWAELTTQSGEPLQSGRAFLFFGALVGLPILIGLLGHFNSLRTFCLFFALAFLSISAFSFQALRTGVRDGYFEARQFRVHKSDSPVLYFVYFGLHACMLPIGLAIGIACAAVVIFNPL